MERALRMMSGARPRQARNMKPLPLAQWLPDLPAFSNPGATIATNVIPFGPSGYKPLPDLSAFSDALTAFCQGAAAVQDIDGVTWAFAADASKLYRLVDTTWTDSSKSGGYTLAADEVVEFVQLDNDIVALQISEDVQGLTLGGTTFSDYFTSTLTPQARHGTQVNAFFMLLNVSEGGVLFPNRLRWSAINSFKDMDASAANQSDAQDVGGNFGWGQRIFGGDYDAVIFFERAIYRAIYEGAPTVFRFDPVSRERGLLTPGAAVQLGRTIFYLAGDGFFMFDGLESHPIGNRKVDVHFADNAQSTYYHRIRSSIDPKHHIVMWSYTSTSASGSTPDRILFYHWPSGWWGEAQVSTQHLFNDLSKATTLEGLDSISTDLDALEFSLDSRVWTGGAMQVGAFDTSNKFATFTGSNLAATIETAAHQLIPGKQTLLTHSMPLVDGGTPTVQVAPQTKLNDTATFGSAGTQATSGWCPTRARGRYHRFRLNMGAAESWTHAQGIQPKGAEAGGR